jgi:hypothetical protein
MNWDIECKFKEITTQLFQKVEKYELSNQLHQIRNRLDSLELSLREVQSENVRLLNRVQELEEGRVIAS